ncbi:MAG: DUF3857 domain-containing protein, partial [Sphingobacteriales bacterium]
MKIVIITALLAALCTPFAFAQQSGSSEWKPAPAIHDVPKSFSKESAVFVLDKRHIEYKSNEKETYVLRTVHRIIKVLDDKGIEGFNKMSVSTGPGREVGPIKARTILPGGKVINVTQDKIRLTKSDDGQEEYVFAMEGMEKNAEVEILYTERREFALFGTEVLQFGIPTMTADFTLITPSSLRFETKGYNGLAATKDTVIDESRIHQTVVRDIPSLEEEPYSNHEAHLMRVSYRLSFSERDNPDVRLFTWNDLAKRLYEQMYVFTDKERKVTEKYLKTLGVSAQDSDEEKIRKIEDGLKTNIHMSDEISDESYLNFDKIVDKKLTTENAYCRFFSSCLKSAGVNFEYGLTSNRFNFPLDDKFENWKLLEIPVIYFPSVKKYLAPTSIFHRMPFLPQGALSNKGVFCKTTTIGDLTSAISTIRMINPLPLETTSN